MELRTNGRRIQRLFKSVTPQGCGVRAYMDVLTASFETDDGYALPCY